MMNKAVLAIALLCASPLHAQTVKDFVEIEGADSNFLTGIGLVLGLNGSGDSPKGESAARLKNLLQHFSAPELAVQTLNAKNAALVVVTADLPPFAKKGTRIDVRVVGAGDAKSILGGELIVTDLRSFLGRADPNLYAVANGRIVGQGDAKLGNPTAGSIPSGALVYKELNYEFVRKATYVDVFNKRREGRAFRLNLRRTDLTLASRLALQINEQALWERRGNDKVWLPVARAADGGAVEVIIPSKEEYEFVRPPKEEGRTTYPGYYDNPVLWVDQVLNIIVRLDSSEKAVVILNDVTKTVAYTGEVKVKPGKVHLKSGTVIMIDAETTLAEAIKVWETAVKGQDLIDAIRGLDSAGLLMAEVRSR